MGISSDYQRNRPQGSSSGRVGPSRSLHRSTDGSDVSRQPAILPSLTDEARCTLTIRVTRATERVKSDALITLGGSRSLMAETDNESSWFEKFFWERFKSARAYHSFQDLTRITFIVRYARFPFEERKRS
jgi:hypothetical protein